MAAGSAFPLCGGLCSLSRHEKLAMGALEAAVAFGVAIHQLALERLLAVRAYDFAALMAGGLAHVTQGS
jgi:hypothetical protein